jgi:chemotaxis protein methyltransferase CheR
MHRHLRHWQANEQLQTMVRFRTVDLLAQCWPCCEDSERFDAIFCRNVIIYLSDSARIHIFEKFSSLIRPDGLMILSRVEGGINQAEPYFKPCGDSVYLLSAAARRTVK